MTIQAEQIQRVITKGLSARRSNPQSLNPHPSFSAPVYVVSMCEALLTLINSAASRPISLQQLLLLERTCTGADYPEKLALRCRALLDEPSPPQSTH
jgi:hypothetical protein